MYMIINCKTNKPTKDPITSRPRLFNDLSTADIWASNLHRESVTRATAWNSIRKTSYKVVAV